MMKRLLIGLSAVAMLVACEDGSNIYSASVQNGNVNFADLAESATTPQRSQKQAAAPTDGYSAAETVGIYLAYRYGYALVMPSTAVKSTSDKHVQICLNAGPSKCQITGSNANSYSDEDIRASLSLRAEPKWLQSFITDMKTDIAEIDGRIESENVTAEDLTRALLDTDARLKAKITLRDRLQNLLVTRNAELPDLLTLEREIARVQGEIESATANLRALRARVSMSVVNINYTSERSAVSRSAVSPIGNAFKDFVGIVSTGIAGVILVVAYLLPWMIFIIIPGAFLLRWFWRRRKTAEMKTAEMKTAEMKTTESEIVIET